MKEINDFEEKVWDFVTTATSHRDLDKLRQLTPIAQEFERIKEDADKIRGAVDELGKKLEKLGYGTAKDKVAFDHGGSTNSGERSVTWEVTAGALAQNILVTGTARKAGLIPTDGSQFEVETSLGQIFRSAELPYQKRLRDGEEIREFYEGVGIKPGDFVKWTEVAPFRYRLEKFN